MSRSRRASQVSWMMDGRWRVDVDEGPYDTLEVYMVGAGNYEIFRSSSSGPYEISHKSFKVGERSTIAEARKFVETRAKENRDA